MIWFYIYIYIHTHTYMENKMATHSSILAWRIPWTEEERGGLQSMGSQIVGHDWVTIAYSHIYMYMYIDTYIYVYIYISFLKYSFPLWFITGYWLCFPVLYNRTVSCIYSIYSSLQLLIPTSHSIPLPTSSPWQSPVCSLLDKWFQNLDFFILTCNW